MHECALQSMSRMQAQCAGPEAAGMATCLLSAADLPAAAVHLVERGGVRLHAGDRRRQPLQVPQLQPACIEKFAQCIVDAR